MIENLACTVPVSPGLQALLDGAEKVRVPGSDPRLLEDPDVVWWIVEGEVDVLAVRVLAGAPAGRFHRLFRARAGEILPCAQALDAEAACCLAARCEAGSLWAKLPREAFLELAGRDASARDRIALWVRKAAPAFSRAPCPERCTVVSASGQAVLAPGQALRAGPEVLGVRLERGAASLLGKLELAAGPDGPWTPLTDVAWVGAATHATVTCRTLEACLGEEPRGVRTRAFLEVSPEMLDLLIEQKEGEERGALETWEKELEETFDDSVRRMAVLLARRKARRAIACAPGDDLHAACSIVGRKLGIRFRQAGRGHGTGGMHEGVVELCRANGVPCRKVALSGRWWRRDSGPLLGFLREGRRPVALIPVSPARYTMVIPSLRRTERVTEESAGRIDAEGFMLYPPLGGETVRGWSLLSLAFRGNGRDLLLVLCMGLLGGGLALVLPEMTRIIFDTVIPQADRGKLLLTASVLTVSTILAALFAVVRSYSVLRISGRAANALQSAVWARVLTLPAAFFRRFTAGDLASRITGINRIRQELSGRVLHSVLQAFFSLTNLFLIWYYSWKLACLAVGLIACNTLVIGAVALFRLRPRRRAFNLQGAMNGKVFQLLSSIEKLHDTGSEARAFLEWSKIYAALMGQTLKAGLIQAAGASFTAAYPALCTLVIFVAYAFLLGPDELSTGQFLAFLTAFGQLLGAFLSLNASMDAVVGIKPLYERARPVLDARPETRESQIEIERMDGKIELTHVSFRYVQEGPQVLNDLSLSIRPGEFVALVGRSGAGKSTVLQLLLGFLTPDSGDIFFDGHNVKDLDPQTLRRHFSVVMQHSQLFAGTLYENIAGASAMTVDQVWGAARQIGLDREIRALPMGMFTYVAEGGSLFSGGQRQRMLIARALANRAPIVLFDEATSSLDNRSQEAVTAYLGSLRTTRVVIAQRLSTIMLADRICVLDGGTIAQAGTYEELIGAPGPFRDLAMRQIA